MVKIRPYKETDYDALIEQANQTIDQQERYELFQQAEAILMTQLPITPIYTESSVRLIHPMVKGVYPNALTHYPFTHVHLQSEATAGQP